MSDEEKALNLSYSSMTLFHQCPKRWKFKYVDKQEDVGSYATVLGKFVHQVLEFFYKEPEDKRTLERAKEIAREQWHLFLEHPKEGTDLLVLVGTSEDDHRLFRQKAWAMIRGLWDLENPESVKVVALEQPFNLAPVDGVRMRGYIDRIEEVNGKLNIVDYKTGNAPRKQYQKEKKDQLILYGLAVANDFFETPSKGRLLYLGSEIISTPITEARLEQMEKEISATAVNIRAAKATGQFEAKPGPLCGWCGYWLECPKGTEEVLRRKREGKLKKTAPAYALAATMVK